MSSVGGCSNEETAVEIRALDSYLTDPVGGAVSPPVGAAPAVLPFEQHSAEDFERICVAVAQHVDGLRDVRLYGVPGQKQHGIDLVGWDADGAAVVFQARRLASFSKRDLQGAVSDFSRSRVFSAKRFVVCAASPARRTEIVDELACLKTDCDFEIDLYDQERLSDMLRKRKDLVGRFFGDEWARVFCDGAAPEPPMRSDADVTADALLRGPLQALGLARVASEAEELAETRPTDAAQAYRAVVAALEGTPFAGLSDSYRLREADCLRRAGELPEAVGILSDVSWRLVTLGGAARTHKAIDALEKVSREDGAPPSAAALVDALRAVDRWHADPFFDVADALVLLDALIEVDSPGTPHFAVWLMESMVVDESFEAILNAMPRVERIAAELEAAEPSSELAARLRACVADATGEWGELLARARRGTLGHRQSFLVHSRAARYLAWAARPDDSRTDYSLAIDQACQAELQAEAAAALLSIANLGSRYGLDDVDWVGAADLARDIRRGGTDYLVSAGDHRSWGLDSLTEDKLPSAFESFRTNLRNAIVSGRLTAELDAHSLLGRLYRRVGEPGLAAHHQIRAGEAAVLEKWCSDLTRFVDCSAALNRETPWERAAALTALAAQGDLVPDDLVHGLVAAAAEMGRGQQQGFFGPQVWHSAHKLLASLAKRLPADLVEQILDQLEPHIQREPNHYRFNDDQHVRIVAGILVSQPDFRQRATSHLLALMGASEELGDTVISKAWEALSGGGEAIVEGLTSLADGGSKAALRALLHLEVEHPRLVEEAKTQLQRATERPKRQAGSYGFGTGLQRAAVYVRLLGQDDRITFGKAAMALAEDATDVEFNRVEALQSVAVLADKLPGHVRGEMFGRVMAIAASPHYCELDEEMRVGAHPLSRFSFNMSSGQLVAHALQAAVELASTDDEYRVAVEAVWPQLGSEDRGSAMLAARTLARVPADSLDVDVQLLAASPIEPARQLAAVLWSHNPAQYPAVGSMLAEDQCLPVRRTLADSLSTVPDDQSGAATSVALLLAKDPSAGVRAAVARVSPALAEDGRCEPDQAPKGAV